MKIFTNKRARKIRVINKELLNRIKMTAALANIRVNFQGASIR